MPQCPGLGWHTSHPPRGSSDVSVEGKPLSGVAGRGMAGSPAAQEHTGRLPSDPMCQHPVFVCLCSYLAICSDLITTQLSSACPGRGGAWGGQLEGRYLRCCQLTLCLEAWVPWGAHTLPMPCPPPPPSLPCLAETCPVGPAPPLLLPTHRLRQVQVNQGRGCRASGRTQVTPVFGFRS